jgi:hypothetical protein
MRFNYLGSRPRRLTDEAICNSFKSIYLLFLGSVSREKQTLALKVRLES